MNHSKLNRFIISLLVLVIFVNVNAYAQEAVYSNGSTDFVPVSDGSIISNEKTIIISWPVTDTFKPPFVVRRIYENQVVDELQTNIASVKVSMSSYTPSKLLISSATGGSISISLRYDFSRVLMFVFVALGILVVVALIFWVLYRHMQARSEVLANATLATVTRKATKRFESVTILFADIQGFTKIAEHADPEQLVDELDRYFVVFDEIVESFNVEKIKTIGDAYMCAGGVPAVNSANPIEVTLVGLSMIAYVRERQAASNGFWNIRVGINSGSVVSGMLGNMKKAFDIWGDSVNTASRMESSSVPGKLNVSGDTYHMISDYFECEYRGKMPVKYKGEVDMYFVNRLKPEYAQGDSINTPNAALRSRIRLLKVMDMESTLLTDLIIPTNDNVRRRFNAFMFQLEFLAKGEGLKDDSYAICKAVAVLLFANLEFSKDCKVLFGNTDKMFKKIRFTDDQIETINRSLQRMLQAKLPESLVEEIIYDARYHYYGQLDMLKYISDWEKELRERGRKINKKDWLKEHKRFLCGFTFYSQTAQRTATKSATEQLKVIGKIIREY